jgi:hypothetical protein
MSGVSRVTGDRLGLVSPVERGRVAVRAASRWCGMASRDTDAGAACRRGGLGMPQRCGRSPMRGPPGVSGPGRVVGARGSRGGRHRARGRAGRRAPSRRPRAPVLAPGRGGVRGRGRRGAGAAGSSPACPVGVLGLRRQAHAGRRDRGGSAARVSPVGRTGQGVVRCAGRGLASRGRLDKAQGGGMVRGACVVPAPRARVSVHGGCNLITPEISNSCGVAHFC